MILSERDRDRLADIRYGELPGTDEKIRGTIKFLADLVAKLVMVVEDQEKRIERLGYHTTGLIPDGGPFDVEP